MKSLENIIDNIVPFWPLCLVIETKRTLVSRQSGMKNRRKNISTLKIGGDKAVKRKNTV